MQTSCWFLGNGNYFTALIFNVYFFNMGSTNLVYLKFWSPVAIYYQRPSWSLIVDWENLWQLKWLAAQNGKRKNIWSIVLLSTKNSSDYQQSLSDFWTIVLDKCIKNIHWTRIKYKYSIQKTQCLIFQYLHSGLVQINTPCFGFFSVVWTGLHDKHFCLSIDKIQTQNQYLE